ncbi:hypothetical protein M8818_007700 [Zalaria obscura]|uniref:Uncharacterized protein n=1 Tax=Zalaria obscura TaxID=2024903 RepID=A0ACC3S3B8_9PEZI
MLGTVLRDVDQDGTETDNASRNEETLGGMQEGSLESRRIVSEAKTYHDDVEDEENHVQNEEDTANGVEAMESERNWFPHQYDALTGSLELEKDRCVADPTYPCSEMTAFIVRKRCELTIIYYIRNTALFLQSVTSPYHSTIFPYRSHSHSEPRPSKMPDPFPPLQLQRKLLRLRAAFTRGVGLAQLVSLVSRGGFADRAFERRRVFAGVNSMHDSSGIQDMMQQSAGRSSRSVVVPRPVSIPVALGGAACL